ncbi:MBL fold metallo-hydrolase [Paenibacillus hamazuiensis]|uniref:MBL fold metallo-hydrolase n=1 Tax=Paenibacillus hamazuiensis TaxID=2936508 RepID=UPI00200C3224|nr:MBL fold metallo-hydrolase [Paenibacillus hamazuiensis]
MTEKRRLSTNVPGDFYVNSACIDCDTCRQLAPGSFSEIGGYSAVTRQPESEDEVRRAFQALLACPTAAIGSERKEGLAAAMDDFPLRLHENVYYCGFTSAKSFGGSSYFIQRPEGNWLIDAPRWIPALVRKFEEMGGIDTIFLTHRDDIADAAQYAERFGAKRIIHEAERSAQPDAEHFVQGTDPIDWDGDFRIVPVPGHTKGHIVLLYRETYLFTGDHLAWDRHTQELEAFDDYCWYSWPEQTASMERLAGESFEWVLPGHGERVRLPRSEMAAAMERLVRRMKG